MYKVLGVILLCFILGSCALNIQEEQPGFVRIEGQKFVDSQGRQLIFSGINFISKNPSEGYLPPVGEEVFEKFRNWGFNCIRLGIIWDGLEPEPGVYNEDYLVEIDRRIEWARKNNIYVFLDMHQDLFGAKFSDGAPDWACLDDGLPHENGAIWSDSYMISPAVQRAFDNFWDNKPAPDGVGVQDHYANLWKMLAQRYADDPTILGYDIMNEPFMGSAAGMIMPKMLEAYATVLVEKTGSAPPTAEELQYTWSQESTRLKALELISDKPSYSKVVDAVYDLNAAFEKEILQKMYQKVASAIREVDHNHILFFNHSYFANTGVRSALEPTRLANGEIDPLVAYAAHGYDLVVDTKEVENPSYDRVEFIFERIHETGKRMNVPVLIGEWGALHGYSPQMVQTAQHLVGVMEEYNFGNTYWAHYNGIEKSPYFKNAVIRPYPMCVAGDLVGYEYDFKTGEFTCTWDEEEGNDSPSIVYVPNLRSTSEADIQMVPEAEQITFEFCDDSNAGKLFIYPSGDGGRRVLKFKLTPGKTEDFSIE